jgi:ATP-dependent DNA helicase PIF1
LLKGGTTCHSRFGLPVPFNKESTSRFSAFSYEADQISKSRVILADEASMMPGAFLIELDSLLRDFTNNSSIFGNKIILLSGDFRQTLPIFPNSTRSEIVAQCINKTNLFRMYFNIVNLTQNMRLNSDQLEFCEWLQQLGNGELPRFTTLHPDIIEIPKIMLLPDITENINNITITRPSSEQDLINYVFGAPFDVKNSLDKNCAILCPLNEDTLRINELVLKKLEGIYNKN